MAASLFFDSVRATGTASVEGKPGSGYTSQTRPRDLEELAVNFTTARIFIGDALINQEFL